ncbi:PP2C family protein-serine/threonine phosphatase [Streptomyces sp. NPDC053429]|uniref:PP2C family protein-serine/threonine phosphatase n=1 Tax=Streptomyces sp. NPDC053429 TaxID=3365702 RepID=UPI0037D4D7F3
MTNFLAVERALRAAAPHALIEAARSALATHFGAHAVELLMADYSLATLHPVTAVPRTAEGLSVHTTVAGRAFCSQVPCQEDAGPGMVVLHLPVSVRGDRFGILSVSLPGELATPETRNDLAEIAGLLGHEVLVAQRDTDIYLQARRVSRLTLAAEMQWQLLPARACSRTEYSIGAQLEPAYAIHGDNFDWASTAENLTLTITNGMGEGIQAALLTNLAVNALRNARRAGVGIADQAALADQALYAAHRGEAYVSTLLLSFELATGRVQVVDAGSPHLWRQRDKVVERIPFEAQFPLGMFDQSEYALQEFRVLPGDRLVFVSDGVYAASSPGGEPYEEHALVRAITSAGLLPAADVPAAVLRALGDYRDRDADDDALVVCLDWHGRGALSTA